MAAATLAKMVVGTRMRSGGEGGGGDGGGGGGGEGGEGGAEQVETGPETSVRVVEEQTVPPGEQTVTPGGHCLSTYKLPPEEAWLEYTWESTIETVPPLTQTPPPTEAPFSRMVHDEIANVPPEMKTPPPEEAPFP